MMSLSRKNFKACKELQKPVLDALTKQVVAEMKSFSLSNNIAGGRGALAPPLLKKCILAPPDFSNHKKIIIKLEITNGGLTHKTDSDCDKKTLAHYIIGSYNNSQMG